MILGIKFKNNSKTLRHVCFQRKLTKREKLSNFIFLERKSRELFSIERKNRTKKKTLKETHLSSKLLPWSLSSGGLASSLLSTSHLSSDRNQRTKSEEEEVRVLIFLRESEI